MLIILILLLLLLGGGGGYWGGNYTHAGYGPGISLGTVLLVLIICWLLGLFGPRT